MRETPEASALSAEIQAAILAEKANVAEERNALDQAGKDRYEPLKEYLRAEAAFKKLKKPTEEDTAAFQDARVTYEEVRKTFAGAQIAYAQKLHESVSRRLEARGVGQEDRERIEARYNRLIRMREIVVPGIKQEQEARTDLLNEQGKGIFRKVLDFYTKKNTQFEGYIAHRMQESGRFKGATEADTRRRARVVARAARVAGFATAGILAGTAGGVGLGISGLSFLVGTGGGLAYGKYFAATKGARRAEQYTQTAAKGIATEEDLAEQAQAYSIGSAEAIDRSRTTRENMFALFSSLGISASSIMNTVGLDGVRNAFSTLWKEFSIPEAHAATAPAQGIPEAPRAEGVGSATPGRAGAEALVGDKAPQGLISGAAIHEKGQGTDKLFAELKDRIGDNAVLSKDVPAVKFVLESAPNEISKALGDAAYGTDGMTVQMGDQFFFDEHQNLWFESSTGEQHLFVENDPNAPNGFKVHELKVPESAVAQSTSEGAQGANTGAENAGDVAHARTIPEGNRDGLSSAAAKASTGDVDTAQNSGVPTRDIPEGNREGLAASTKAPTAEAATPSARDIPEGNRDGLAASAKAPAAGADTPNARDIPEGNRTGLTEARIAPEAPKNAFAAEAINERGEGTDSVFKDLKETIKGKLPAGQQPSAALKHFLESNPNEISRAVGTEAYGADGMRTHLGDTFFFDKDQNLWFKPEGGEPQPFIMNDVTAENGFKVHELDAEPNRTVASPTEAPPQEAPTASGEAARPEVSRPEPVHTATPHVENTTSAPVSAPDTHAGEHGPTPVHTEPNSPALVGSDSDFISLDDGDRPATTGAPVAATEAPAPVSGGDSDFIPSSEINPEARIFDAAWVPGDALPTEPAVFSFVGPDGTKALFANVSQDALPRFAEERGIDLRGRTVMFDNTQYDGWGNANRQVGSATYDSYGKLVRTVAQVRDANGVPVENISTTFLKERIA
jgi:hypothetical protein